MTIGKPKLLSFDTLNKIVDDNTFVAEIAAPSVSFSNNAHNMGRMWCTTMNYIYENKFSLLLALILVIIIIKKLREKHNKDNNL